MSDISWDLLLESISYLTDGSWPSFERAFESVDEQGDEASVSARDAARVLVALGHVDLRLDPYSMRPVRWSVAPPALIQASDGALILCGHRPSRLVGSLEAAAARHGLNLAREPLAGQPCLISVTGGDELRDAALPLIEELRGEGHEITVNWGGAPSLAAALPSVPELISHLRHATPAIGASAEALRVDGSRLSWKAVSDHFEPGVYRFNPPPTVYGYVDKQGSAPARVDARLARLLATLDAGLDVLAWDPESQVASARYYAEPPALYERALVLCSGRAPDASQHGSTRYAAVSQEVAYAIHARLRSPRQLTEPPVQQAAAG
jgi:hypothetical protein